MQTNTKKSAVQKRDHQTKYMNSCAAAAALTKNPQRTNDKPGNTLVHTPNKNVTGHCAKNTTGVKTTKNESQQIALAWNSKQK